MVVANNQVLAVEGPEGTDQDAGARGASCAAIAASTRRSGVGVLVKAPKAGQDHRIDLPVIGPPTVEAAAAAGLAGVAVVAGSTLVAEPERIAAAADRARHFRHRRQCRWDRPMTAEAPRRSDQASGELEIFLVAAEESGDRLGAALMRALRQRSAEPLRFSGVGGREMAAAGLVSLLPIDDFAIIGFSAIPRPAAADLSATWSQTVRAVLARRPHALVIIDSPAFTLRVARFVRWFDRSIPIIDYVSPSVWAWRAGRARSMRALRRPCAGAAAVRARRASQAWRAAMQLCRPPADRGGLEAAAERAPRRERRMADPPIVLAMPGSRSSEVARLAGIFGEALALVAERVGPIEVVVPTVPHLLAQVTQATRDWPIKPRIVVEQAEKHAALRVARAALAKSGTTTLELAVAGVPMVAAYKVSPLEAAVIRRLVRVPSYILANLVIGRERRARTGAGGLHAGAACRHARRRCSATRRERQRQVEAFATPRCHHGDRLPRARRPRRRHRARPSPARRWSDGCGERKRLSSADPATVGEGRDGRISQGVDVRSLLMWRSPLQSAADRCRLKRWPSRPVKVIMATAAGSAPDVTARVVTDRLAQIWGQQVLILNRPGAGGLIALQALATAERDNHTLYFPSSSSLVVLPETNSKLPLDFERDLVPIGIIGE